jgi:hypothetical protein
MSALRDDLKKFAEPGLLIALVVLFALLAFSDVAIWLAYKIDSP